MSGPSWENVSHGMPCKIQDLLLATLAGVYGEWIGGVKTGSRRMTLGNFWHKWDNEAVVVMLNGRIKMRYTIGKATRFMYGWCQSSDLRMLFSQNIVRNVSLVRRPKILHINLPKFIFFLFCGVFPVPCHPCSPKKVASVVPDIFIWRSVRNLGNISCKKKAESDFYYFSTQCFSLWALQGGTVLRTRSHWSLWGARELSRWCLWHELHFCNPCSLWSDRVSSSVILGVQRLDWYMHLSRK